MFKRFFENYRKAPTGKKIKIIIIAFLIIVFGSPLVINTIAFLTQIEGPRHTFKPMIDENVKYDTVPLNLADEMLRPQKEKQ